MKLVAARINLFQQRYQTIDNLLSSHIRTEFRDRCANNGQESASLGVMRRLVRDTVTRVIDRKLLVNVNIDTETTYHTEA